MRKLIIGRIACDLNELKEEIIDIFHAIIPSNSIDNVENICKNTIKGERA